MVTRIIMKFFSIFSGKEEMEQHSSAVWQQFQSEPQRKVCLQVSGPKFHGINKYNQEKNFLKFSYSSLAHYELGEFYVYYCSDWILVIWTVSFILNTDYFKKLGNK